MKSIKKIKKYGTAAVGTALLVGATLTGAAAANHGGSSGSNSMDLGDYPGNGFVAEDGTVTSSIVVGDDAKTVDVVGAIDIAGSLSQAAYDSVPVEGGETASSVDGESLDEQVIDEAVSTTSIDASDASFFVRDTVEDDDGDDVFVSESATISADSTIDSRINGTTTDLDINKDSIHYSVSYSPGFAINDTLQMLGEEFELTGFDGSQVELGSTQENTNLQIDETVSHGPYTVKVEGANSDNSEVLVQISEDGTVVESGQLEAGDTLEVDDGDFTVQAETTFYSTQNEQWSIRLDTTYSDTTLEEGEDVPLDSDYIVDSISRTNLDGDTHVTGITLRNDFASADEPEDADEIDYQEAGEAVEGPAGYFEVQNDGLTSESMNEVEFEAEGEVTFMDPNAQEQTVDFAEDVTDGADVGEDDQMSITGEDKGNDNEDDHYFVEVTSVQSNSEEVTVEHADFEKEFDLDDAQANGATGTSYDGEAASGGTDAVAYQKVSTGYGFDVTVEWVDDTDANGNSEVQSGEVDRVNVYSSYGGLSSSGSNLAGQTFTIQGGAELSQNLGDVGSLASSIEDTPEGSNTPYLTLSETEGDDDNQNGDDVHVFYEDGTDSFDDAESGEIGGVYADSPGDGYGDVEDGEEGLSKFGTSIELQSASSAVLHYPDEERFQQVAFGDVGASGGDSGMTGTSMEPAGWPNTGALDTDESIGQRKSQDSLILVGGPLVNDLTQELAADGQTWDGDEWMNGDHEGESILQMTEGFEGGHALVVAGHSGEDTRVAAQYLSNYESHSEELSGESQVTISTQTGSVVQ